MHKFAACIGTLRLQRTIKPLLGVLCPPTSWCAHRQLEYFKIDPGLPDNDSLAEMDLFFDAEPPDDDSRSFPQWGFTSFPEVFCQLPNLQGIHMLRQQLGTLPAALSNLKKLASLQL